MLNISKLDLVTAIDNNICTTDNFCDNLLFSLFLFVKNNKEIRKREREK